jgi:hypothetical protein
MIQPYRKAFPPLEGLSMEKKPGGFLLRGKMQDGEALVYLKRSEDDFSLAGAEMNARVTVWIYDAKGEEIKRFQSEETL